MKTLFSVSADKKIIVGVIHLKALPGAPGFGGSFQKILDHAAEEARIYSECGIHGIIIENYHDIPFFPDTVQPITVACMAAIAAEIKKQNQGIPIGLNVLRNDAAAAIAVAVASNAQFIRVNVHSGAMLTDQGIVQGKAHETLRLRESLIPHLKIFADVLVKHAAPLVDRGIENEVSDLAERGMADVIIVSGSGTGMASDPKRVSKVKASTRLPVFIGSGITAENVDMYTNDVDGFIVGSYFKKAGRVNNELDRERIMKFMDEIR